MNHVRRVAERPARTRHARAGVRSAAAVVVAAALLASGSLSASANDDVAELLREAEGRPVPVAELLEELAGPERVDELRAQADQRAELFAALAPETFRVAGNDRYETAVAISTYHDPGVPVVYVANGQGFADALGAAPAAAVQEGSLLLVQPNRIPDVVRDELQRLEPGRIVVVGGTSAVSTSVENALRAYAPVTRIAGANRYETSRKITEYAFSAGDGVAFLATGTNFPDALAAGAAAGAWEIPVILVNGRATSTDAPTRQLLGRLDIEGVYIAGGPSAVSWGIEDDLWNRGWGTYRLSGNDRYETSAAINEIVWESSPVAFFATGAGFADALSGAAVAGQIPFPLYVVRQSCVPGYVLDHGAYLGIEEYVLLGGTSALGSGVESLTRCR